MSGPGVTPGGEPIKVGPIQFGYYPSSPSEVLRKYYEVCNSDPESMKLVRVKFLLDRFIWESKALMCDTTYAVEKLELISKIGKLHATKTLRHWLETDSEALKPLGKEEILETIKTLEKLADLSKYWNRS